MSNPVPSSVALTTIADGSPRIAAPIRNNFSALQAFANAINAILAGGTAGQVLTAADASNVQWADSVTRYTKTTAKAVNTTVAATDLLNAEINVALTAGKTLEAVLFGDFLNSTAGSRTAPRFQLVVGGTTVLDTGTSGTCASNAARANWGVTIKALGLGGASQLWKVEGFISGNGGSSVPTSNLFTTGIGWYRSYGGSTDLDVTFRGGNSTTVDMTSSQAFVFNVINGFSNASYETRLNGGCVQIG